MIGFVLVFHRLKGPQALGISLALFQLVMLMLYYVCGCVLIWGVEDFTQITDTAAPLTADSDL